MTFEPLERVSVEAFERYHADNPGIYNKLVEFARQAVSRGATHIGIGMLFERVRWYSTVEAQGDPFKLNNSYRAFYARKMMAEHKDLAGLFELRTSIADSAGPKKIMRELAMKRADPPSAAVPDDSTQGAFEL